MSDGAPEPSRIEAEIFALLERRGAGKSICPSEAARALAEDWRPQMEAVRVVARRLAREGRLRITRGDHTLSPDQPFGGPIRLRLPDSRHPTT